MLCDDPLVATIGKVKRRPTRVVPYRVHNIGHLAIVGAVTVRTTAAGPRTRQDDNEDNQRCQHPDDRKHCEPHGPVVRRFRESARR
jgi:hypothetical protein